ncbi:MAG: C2 family cysteine protease [Desulfoprunum sp.]|nr:C2 family cysteine protease [Desulfoprunum sp.]
MSSDIPNEIVEDFSQGGYGDCWYLASLKSLSISSLGQQIFNDVINVGVNSATVTFQGTLEYTYEISLSAFAAERNDIDYAPNVHSYGDADVLLLEMALISYANVANFTSPLNPSGGDPGQALSLITGKKSAYFSNWTGDVDAVTAKLDELAQIIDHTAITAACYNEANLSLGIPATDHAYSIIGINKVNKTVSFRNPWYSGTVLNEISYANFAFYFQSIAYVDLTTNNKALFALDINDSILNGDVGDDELWGGAGDDTLNGGAGDDYLYSCDGNDILNGGDGADTLIAWGGNDTLNGGAGADYLIGKTGNDTYRVDSLDSIYENANEGFDTIISDFSRAISPNVENLILAGASDLSASGNELNNQITGNTGRNSLWGGAGADSLNGAGGADILDGGSGNDTYYIDNAGDVTTETSTLTTEIDTVISSVTHTLGNYLEKLILSGIGTINGYGNALSNTIAGNGAANILNGAAGADTMTGGLGNDTYHVDNAGDATIETSTLSTEIDTVISSVSRTLGNYLEKLTLSGTGAINGYGNSLNNTIIGNGAANVLRGEAGNDCLNGGLGIDHAYYNTATSAVSVNLNITAAQNTLGAGIDTLVGIECLVGSNYADKLTGNTAANILNGGAGADNMIGGLGNDTYYVDNVVDITTETSTLATEIDTVISFVSRSLVGNYLEQLVLSGTGAINGYGNYLNNIIIGNAANNYLYGGSGNDILRGSTGNDYLSGDAGTDSAYYNTATSAVKVNLNVTTAQITGGDGTDTLIGIENLLGSNFGDSLIGNAGNNTLYGGIGNDALFGGLGNDYLVGGAGLDTFVFDSALSASTNKDSITDFSHVDDTIKLDMTIFAKLTTLGTLSSSFFKSSASGLGDSNDYLLYNTSTGALLYDADATGAGVAVQFATLTTKPTISNTDFMIVA